MKNTLIPFPGKTTVRNCHEPYKQRDTHQERYTGSPCHPAADAAAGVQGPRKIGLFGSYSRDEQRPDSDIDLLVEFTDNADLFDLAELKYYLEEKLRHPVDIVPEKALRDELKQGVLADVCYV